MGRIPLAAMCVCSEQRCGRGCHVLSPPNTNPSKQYFKEGSPSPPPLLGRKGFHLPPFGRGRVPASEVTRTEPLGRFLCRCFRPRPGKTGSLYLPGNSERNARRARSPRPEERARPACCFRQRFRAGGLQRGAPVLPSPAREQRGRGRDSPTQLSTSPSPPRKHSPSCTARLEGDAEGLSLPPQEPRFGEGPGQSPSLPRLVRRSR